MTVVLSIFGVAFAAFCVWLLIRVINKREKWAKRTLAVAVALPVLYAASFGPACWFASRSHRSADAVAVIYQPITALMFRTTAVAMIMVPYSELLAAPHWHWVFISELDQARWMPFDISAGMPLDLDDEDAPVAAP